MKLLELWSIILELFLNHFLRMNLSRNLMKLQVCICLYTFTYSLSLSFYLLRFVDYIEKIGICWIIDKEDKEMMRNLLQQLPKPNLETIRLICEHLAVVAQVCDISIFYFWSLKTQNQWTLLTNTLCSQHSVHNKMNIPNLARCFGPDYNKIFTFLITSGLEYVLPSFSLEQRIIWNN